MKKRFQYLIVASAMFLGAVYSPVALATLAPPIADSYINSGAKNQNNGAAQNLLVSPTHSALARFDLSTLPAGIVSTDVEKATILLFVNNVTAAGTVTVYAVSSPWTESGVTFNTQPGLGAPIATVAVAHALLNQVIAVDVTAQVKAWISLPGTNNGLELVATGSPATASLSLDSKEAGGGVSPMLEISLFNTGPAGPTGSQGPTGAIGPAGPAGATGAAGAQGPQGIVGPAGPIGPQGGQGPMGAIGAIGPQGAQGPVGLQGPTGPAGAIGPSGAMGATGTTGPAGPAGPQGMTGPAGAQGPQGVPGAGLNTGGVSGSVLSCGVPVAGSLVYIAGRSFVAYTGGTGTFELDYVPMGIYDISIQPSQGIPQTVSGVTIAQGQLTATGPTNVADTSGDVNNCGTCGNVCAVANGTPTCSGGTCQVKGCFTGFADCNLSAADGCETNISSDVNNCGKCGLSCGGINGTPTCNAGVCQLTCNAGFTNCRDICVNTFCQ